MLSRGILFMVFCMLVYANSQPIRIESVGALFKEIRVCAGSTLMDDTALINLNSIRCFRILVIFGVVNSLYKYLHLKS